MSKEDFHEAGSKALIFSVANTEKIVHQFCFDVL
jgi:hypothetical protein